MKKRSRNKIDARLAVKNTLFEAETYHITSQELMQRLMALKERFNVPERLWAWADGYADAVRDRWFREKLVYCYVWNGQKVPSKWDSMPEDLKEHIRKGGEILHGHFWKNRDGTIGKPWFTS